MLISTDIDQFSIIYMITIQKKSINMIGLKYRIFGEPIYLPKELFNMVQISFINFRILKGKSIYYYDNESKAINHSFCNWDNLINLNYAHGLGQRYTDGHEDILRVLRCL